MNVPRGYLTDDEIELVEQAGELATSFMRLGVMHPSDRGDVVFHVHAIQSIIMGRAAQRAHPDRIPIKGDR